ncbi:putative bacteriophage protein [Escherichia coli]|uniref:Putative bacteriophage protein n=1 Tax=Escherichia coli TaxID=562 RepID=A0A447XGU5_ECOLX|nr:putative bacteriophage protein [Escherichia coli]
MEIKPEDELSNIVLFPVKEDDPRNQVNFLYEPSERPYCHHASVRVDEKERQVRCKICGAVVSRLTGCSLWRKEKPDWQMM